MASVVCFRDGAISEAVSQLAFRRDLRSYHDSALLAGARGASALHVEHCRPALHRALPKLRLREVAPHSGESHAIPIRGVIETAL